MWNDLLSCSFQFVFWIFHKRWVYRDTNWRRSNGVGGILGKKEGGSDLFIQKHLVASPAAHFAHESSGYNWRQVFLASGCVGPELALNRHTLFILQITNHFAPQIVSAIWNRKYSVHKLFGHTPAVGSCRYLWSEETSNWCLVCIRNAFFEWGVVDAHFSINIEFECEKSTDNKYGARAKRPSKPPKTHVKANGGNVVTGAALYMPYQRLSAKLSYALSIA